jgi:hypothetical protein
LRQPSVRFDEAVLVRVFANYYEIAGKRFDGSLADQLDRYADTRRKISIVIIGSETVIRARAPELDHLRGNLNIHIATIASRRSGDSASAHVDRIGSRLMEPLNAA